METALVAVLRGGDGITLPPKKRFIPSDLASSFPLTTRADITFLRSASGDVICVQIMCINCKAKGVEARRKLPRFLPMDGDFLSPGRMLYWLTEVFDPVPEHLRASTPLFRTAEGLPFSMAGVRSGVRRVMDAAGRDGSVYGVHSLRIGGGQL